jgi:hypothetical protein
LPASIGVYNALEDILIGRRIQSMVLIFCATFILLYRPVVRPFITFYHSKPYRLSCIFPTNLSTLLNFLEKHTNREGRILIEDSEFSQESPPHEYYGGHFPGLFPEFLTREYLCGPRPMYPTKHSYASYVRGVMFDKKIADYSLSEMQDRFDTYNVKWLVCWYKESKEFFERFPEYIKKMADIDKFSVYEVKRVPSFFLKGRGTVHADYNRLELDNVSAEDDEIIIAYHWMKGLKSVPERKVEKVFVAGDPVGFIKITNPPRTILIRNDY